MGSDSVTDYATVLTVNSDTDITLTGNYAGTTAAGAYHSYRRLTVTDTSSIQTIDNTFRVNKFGNVGNLFATISFGVNSNEIVLRRVTTQGKWVSPLESDVTLSSWSTYLVGNPVLNGNSLIYEVGLSTSNTITAGNTNLIVPGTIISTDPTKAYAQADVTFILGNFASSSFQSLIMNYVGIGSDGKLPTAYVYNNEMYLAVTQQGQGQNSEILFLDRKGAWGNWTQSVTNFTKYNQQLYAGSSLNGNIYKLRYGLNAAGSAYSLTAIGKEDLLGSLELKKDVNKAYVVYKTQTNGSFTFSYRLDNYLTNGGSTWVDQTIDQTSGGLVEIDIKQTCTSIQFKVSQNDKDVQVGIIGFIVLYGYLSLR